jgi:hypothetical protein
MQASLRNCRNQASDAKGEAQGPKPRGDYRVGVIRPERVPVRYHVPSGMLPRLSRSHVAEAETRSARMGLSPTAL